MKKLAYLPNERTIRCILFDLGYTLWDRRRNPQLWSQVEMASNRLAVSILRQHIAPEWLPPGDDDMLGERLRETFDKHEHDIIRHDPAREPNGPEAVLRTLKDWEIKQADATLGKLVFESLNIRIPNSFPLLEAALPTLAALRERGYLLGVVTNRMWGGEAFGDDLRALGLLDYFDGRGIAVSADMGVRKPYPALFWQALNGLHVAPKQAAMVGDSLRTDILGAQKLGLFTVWLPRPKQREQVRAYLASAADESVPVHEETPPPEPSPEDDSTESSLYDEDYLPANVPGKDGYLERFLRGEIKPDLMIEQVSDLLDIFMAGGVVQSPNAFSPSDNTYR